MTVQEIIDKARSEMDAIDESGNIDPKWSNAEMLSWVQEAQRAINTLLVDHTSTLVIKKQSFNVVIDQLEYPLNAVGGIITDHDFIDAHMLYLYDTANNSYTSEIQILRFEQAMMTSGSVYILDNTLVFKDKPTEARTYHLYYFKKAETDLDTTDEIDLIPELYQDVYVYFVCRRMARKDKQSTEDWDTDYKIALDQLVNYLYKLEPRTMDY